MNNLTKIIYLNIAIFICIHILHIASFLINKDIEIIPYLTASANIKTFIQQPWTLITYMFVHEDFFHILVNLFWLYFSGQIFIQYLNNKELFSTYIMSGLVGVIFYISSFNIFPVFETMKYNSFAIGASASVLGLLIASATHVPNFTINLKFIGNIKLKYIAGIAIIIDILSIPKGNAGGHIAHLGGAVYGYTYIYLRKKGLNTNYIIDIISSFLFKHKNNRTKMNKIETDYEYNTRKRELEKKINQILDKINESGYESLSKEEKEILFQQK